jgi:hypothetical protein
MWFGGVLKELALKWNNQFMSPYYKAMIDELLPQRIIKMPLHNI